MSTTPEDPSTGKTVAEEIHEKAREQKLKDALSADFESGKPVAHDLLAAEALRKEKEMEIRHNLWQKSEKTAYIFIPTMWFISLLFGIQAFCHASKMFDLHKEAELTRFNLAKTIVANRINCLTEGLDKQLLFSVITARCDSSFDQEKVTAMLATIKTENHWYDRLFIFAPFVLWSSLSFAITIAYMRHAFMKNSDHQSHNDTNDKSITVADLANSVVNGVIDRFKPKGG